MIYAINYANGEPFESFRAANTSSAYSKGKVDKVIEYTIKDIDDDYIKEHQTIFDYKRGAGLWIWKPYLIYKTLLLMPENDWLIYADSGSIYINDVRHLIKCAEEGNTDLMLFTLPLLNRQFTKNETLRAFDIGNNNMNQLAANFLVLKNTTQTQGFLYRW